MSKLNLLTLTSIITLVFAVNVHTHQYVPKRTPTFPYMKFSQKLDVIQKVEIQVPKVHDVEMDKIIPKSAPITKTHNYKLHAPDISREFDMNSLRPKTIVHGCGFYGCITFGEIIVPPLLPPIISPIADPFNGDLLEVMSIKEFYSWWRDYR